jgi:ribonuclease R
MDFSIATLLSHFSDDKLVAGKALEKKLGCEDDESVEIYELFVQGKTDEEILSIINNKKNMEEKTNEMYQINQSV